MSKQLQLRRVLLLLLLLGAAFAGLGYRLVDLQVLRHDELARMAQLNTAARFFRGAAPGQHFGRERQPAGHEHFRENVCADRLDWQPAGGGRPRARAVAGA